MINSGVNTYRIDLSNKEKKTAIAPGNKFEDRSAVVISAGSFSQGFEFRVKDYCKDSFTMIFTQALINRLSNNNMDVIYVVSLEEKGEAKNKWFGCYAINDNFKQGFWTILNGKHKLEEYKITDSTYVKAYIWNKGKGDLAISYLELMFDNPVNMIGEKTLITQIKNEEVQSESGYHPFKEKTIINVERIKVLPSNCNYEQLHYKDGAILFTNNGGVNAFNLKSQQLTSVFKSGKNSTASNIATTGLTNYIFPRIHSSLIPITKSLGASINFKDTSINTNISGSLITSENNYSATSLFLCIGTDGKEVFQVENNLSFKKLSGQINLPKGYSISSLKEVSPENYICTALNNGEVMIWLGNKTSTAINFKELSCSSDVQKKLLDLDSSSDIFPLQKKQFLVFSKSKRNALYRIEITAANNITILEAYHLANPENKISPFYFEKTMMTRGLYNGKTGYFIYGYNVSTSTMSEFKNSNHSLYFFEIKCKRLNIYFL